ncbi:hypothetical protein sscle_05g047760 [Sclerotinia sclerotiorum 1980 UF-70]|uniref:Zn(2)-C6 fungal-type domain-containing protein n=1 Tax=Sclerotinia sclerotiorum (strain ATCC 18683 / 1980 / Ss-1) TaxID=665079 RepID=A0A1D9Q544_SCLS1|nr:hypothetical protein sscle_05g047760 [Sclerotinia sclerotiorum 1980 UF-70]
MPSEDTKIPTPRKVCDHCRRRRIRCDGNLPCKQCGNALLNCKREHIPKRRGPKRGSGRVINELRAQNGGAIKTFAESRDSGSGSGGSSSRTGSIDIDIDCWVSNAANSSAAQTYIQRPTWHPIMSDISPLSNDGTNGIFTTDQFRPTCVSYMYLIPTCLDLFLEHLYPIMPLVHMPTLKESINRPLQMHEKNLIYSLCAITSTHMSGKNILAPGPPSWEIAGRFFLDECIMVRQGYDFVDDRSLSAVISSYFVSTAFFELNQSRKSWYYLREAMTMAQDIGLHEEFKYSGLHPAEELCRRRTFWILYVTERSFAILRHKPLTLSKTPALPSTLHDYEAPEIHSGFMHLVHSYHLLDSNFVDSWNEASDAPVSTLTYTALQQQLNISNSSHVSLTAIQKADILVTQQWLRLIVWQSSMRQGLLSSGAADESMTFRYPLKIAHSLLSVISSLPITSIEVHGMGIFEKIFEIGNSMVDIMQAYGSQIPHEVYGICQDPFDMFVRTLSQTPNSQRQYANLLLAKVAEKPEIQRFSHTLTKVLSIDNMPHSNGSISNTIPHVGEQQWVGSIVGEIKANEDAVSKEDMEKPTITQ